MRFSDRTAAFLTPLARGSGGSEQPLDIDATPALTRQGEIAPERLGLVVDSSTFFLGNSRVFT